MPIDLCGSISKTSRFVFGSPLLNNILGSSLFVAIVIALVMMLLIMIMYPAKKGTPFSTVGKMFLYMFFISLLVVFLHDGVIKFMIEEEDNEKTESDFMRGTTLAERDVVYGQTQPINPVIQLESEKPLPPIGAQMPAQSVQNAQQVVVKGGDNGTQQPPVVSYVDGGREMLGGSKAPPRQQNKYR